MPCDSVRQIPQRHDDTNLCPAPLIVILQACNLYLYLYLYLWLMDRRSVSFRAGPYLCNDRPAASWMSSVTELRQHTLVGSSSCLPLSVRRRTFLYQGGSVSCTASSRDLSVVFQSPSGERMCPCWHFLFQTGSCTSLSDRLWFCVFSELLILIHVAFLNWTVN